MSDLMGLRGVAEQAVIRGVRMPLDARKVLALLNRVETAERERDDLDMKHSLAAGHLELAYEALQRVREVHKREFVNADYGGTRSICIACERPFPCPTINALEGDE